MAEGKWDILAGSKTAVFTQSTFCNLLSNELKTLGQEIILPEPSQAIVEVHNILVGSGFDVAPVVYVDIKKGEATFGVLETVVRPDYTDGTQMYYSDPDKDPLAKILEEGRIGQQHSIAISDRVRNVPIKSRFAVSWDEIHKFVVPAVCKANPRLKEQATKSGIVFRVPTRAEFQSSGARYPHFGEANSWEWLYDSARFDYRLFGDRRLFGGHRDFGGLPAVGAWQSDRHLDNFGFRLQAVSPPQKLPR